MGYTLTQSTTGPLRLLQEEQDLIVNTCEKHRDSSKYASDLLETIFSGEYETSIAYASSDGALFTTCLLVQKGANGNVIVRQGVTKRVTYVKMEDEHNPTRAREIALARACLASPILI